MQRDRVAVVGGKGIFADTVMAVLDSSRSFHVQRFTLDGQDGLSEEISAFGPDLIVLVGGIDQPVPQAILPQVEKGVAIVILDPEEPTMGFSCQVRQTPASMETVMRTVQAAHFILKGEPQRLTPAEREVRS